LGSGDHGHTTTDKVSHQRPQEIELPFQPVVVDRRILALDVARFAEALAERAHIVRGGSGRPDVDEAHHRQRRVLRPRGKRPRRRRAEPPSR
jgi:hypothetical protein